MILNLSHHWKSSWRYTFPLNWNLLLKKLPR